MPKEKTRMEIYSQGFVRGGKAKIEEIAQTIKGHQRVIDGMRLEQKESYTSPEQYAYNQAYLLELIDKIIKL